jgi:integrase
MNHSAKGGQVPKGSQIKVMPIKNLEDIASIKDLLADEPRNLALFKIGINSALKTKELAELRVKQVRDLTPGDCLKIKDRNDSKIKKIYLNNMCIETIKNLIDCEMLNDNDPLFRSQKGGGPLRIETVHKLVKGFCEDINLEGNFGSHTLRKTFGYHRIVTFGRSLKELTKLLGHSSKQVTLDYLCIQDDEIKEFYMDEL